MNRSFFPLAAGAAALLLVALPAEAHRLKLFAHVVGNDIAGYGFYIGGGRPQGTAITVFDSANREVGHLVTDKDGAYAWTPPQAGTYRLSVNGGDGHFAEATVAFEVEPAVPPAAAAPAAVSAPATAPAAPLSPETVGLIEASVDKAVARQITPLLQAYNEADGKVRFNDILGGLGWIVGLAGLWLWFRTRLSSAGGPPK